jgi:hypothetical protein
MGVSGARVSTTVLLFSGLRFTVKLRDLTQNFLGLSDSE